MIKKIPKTLNDNIANFPDGLYSETQVQLPTWVLKCLLLLETVDVQGEDENDERDPHV